MNPVHIGAVIFGVAVGNFGWECISGARDWGGAVDRVFYQWVAVALVVIFGR